jgi:hypothetical protein
VLVYGVVSAQTVQAVELLPTREQAERFVAEVEADEPDLAGLLRVEAFELGASSPN